MGKCSWKCPLENHGHFDSTSLLQHAIHQNRHCSIQSRLAYYCAITLICGNTSGPLQHCVYGLNVDISKYLSRVLMNTLMNTAPRRKLTLVQLPKGFVYMVCSQSTLYASFKERKDLNMLTFIQYSFWLYHSVILNLSRFQHKVVFYLVLRFHTVRLLL